MKEERKDRHEAYPKPTEADKQYKEQDEFTQRQGNRINTQNEGPDSTQDINEVKRRNPENDTIGNP